MIQHLDVRKVEPLQVTGVDIGRDHVAGRPDLARQPYRHRASSRADLQTAPPGLNQRPPPARHGVVELLEKVQPRVFGALSAARRKPVARLDVESFLPTGRGPGLPHAEQRSSGDPPRQSARLGSD